MSADRQVIVLTIVLLGVVLLASSGLWAQSAPPSPGTLESQNAPAAQSAPAVQPPAAVEAPQNPQTPEMDQAPPADAHPIAIVPLDNKLPGHAAEVTGSLHVYNGRAFIDANASITSGSETAHVTLPYRGTLLVCSSTTVKLAADSSVPSGDVPGLLMAMDRGAVEVDFATGRNSDSLLTPDFRILISGPGAANVKVRLGPMGDTCVDNPGADAPYVLVSSVFDGGAYRVQPGQRVMFQHGSLHEVVDQEKESCGCPPPAPKGNEFPLAQSEGLAPLPNPGPEPPVEHPAGSQSVPPLVYKSADHAPQPVAIKPVPVEAITVPPAPPTAPKKKQGFFSRLMHSLFGGQ